MSQNNNSLNGWVNNDAFSDGSDLLEGNALVEENELPKKDGLLEQSEGREIVANRKIDEFPEILSEEDVKLLNSFASKQLSYGHAHEAIALLLLCRLNSPDNLQSLSLLIRAYLKVEWWEKADEMTKEYKRCNRNGYLANLFSSLSLLGQARFSEARREFDIFRQNKLKG